MVKQPFFSVIVPTHNRLEALSQVIPCLINQNYPAEGFEIIIVDDDSTDGTLACLQEWAAYGKLKYATQPRRGPGAARNLGAQMAHGEVLAFIDSDCLPGPGWLAALAEAYQLAGEEEVAAVGGPIQNFASGHWLHRFQALRGSDHVENNQPAPLYLDTANASFRRTAFCAVGGFNPTYRWSEDVDLGFRMRGASYRICTAPSAVVQHMGTSSFASYLHRSYRAGYGTARLQFDYPQTFDPSPAGGLYLTIRSGLDRLVQNAGQALPPWRGLRVILAGLLRGLVQFLAEEKAFFGRALPGQYQRFHFLHLSGFRVCIYLGLEWLCHLAFLSGQAVQSVKIILQLALADQERKTPCQTPSR